MMSSVLVQVLFYSLIQASSYLCFSASPLTLTHLLQKTGMTLVTFMQQLWQHLYWNIQALYLAVVQSVAEPGNSISIWGTNPDILGRNKVKEVGRREAETYTRLQNMTTHCPSPYFTNRRATCQSGPQGLKWISGILEDCLQPKLQHNSGLSIVLF